MSKAVNSYLANAMDVFAKVAKEIINNIVGEKFKAVDRTSYRNTPDNQALRNKIKRLQEQLTATSNSGGGKKG